jgi:hypothetical protein
VTQRRDDTIEWTTRGRVFLILLVFAFLGAMYLLSASGVLAEFGRALGQFWASNFVPHASPR